MPVKSTAQLVGAGHSPPDGFYWLTDATGVYANPGLSTVWANVFPSGTPADPYVYFGREPGALPFWKDGAPAGTENRAEFFVNLYSALKSGNLCFQLYEGSSATGSPIATCNDVTGVERHDPEYQRPVAGLWHGRERRAESRLRALRV